MAFLIFSIDIAVLHQWTFVDGDFIINDYGKNNDSVNNSIKFSYIVFIEKLLRSYLEDYLREIIGKTEQTFQKSESVSIQIYWAVQNRL